MNEIFDSCIEACNRCAAECESCASMCLKEEHVQSMARCIQLDMDCSLLCVVTAKLLARNSDQASEIAELCAAACRRCAEECRKHDMEHCQECADACIECAEECEEVVEQHAH